MRKKGYIEYSWKNPTETDSRPKAFVVPRPGTNPTPEEIIEFTKERLARFKAPNSHFPVRPPIF